MGDNSNSDPDRDGDGIGNDFETKLGFDPNDPAVTPPDQDADGTPDVLDDDRDGDGVPNDVDLFPTDPAESSDIDSDGIGDNADPDRDGDGYSNTEEADAGTDPNDPASFPDREPPALSLDGLDQRETEAESLTLSGAVADSGSGLAAMSLGSDRFPATHLAVQVDQGHWSVTVPLEIGFNQLTLVATDAAGNQAQLQVLIERTDSSSPLGLSVREELDTHPLKAISHQ